MIKFVILFSLKINAPMRVNVANINYFYPNNTSGAVVVMSDGGFFEAKENPQHIDTLIMAANRMKLEDIDRIWNGMPPFGKLSAAQNTADFALEYFPKLITLAKAAKDALRISQANGDYFHGMTAIEAALAEVEAGLLETPQ